MSRPLYESKVDRSNEQQVIERLAHLWQAQWAKLPLQYKVDYAVLKAGRVGGWVEVKCRNERYEYMYLSLAKWREGIALSRDTGVPFVVAYRIRDRIYYRVCPVDESPPVSIYGRRDRGDWQDEEPMVLFDIKDFKVVDAYQ